MARLVVLSGSAHSHREDRVEAVAVQTPVTTEFVIGWPVKRVVRTARRYRTTEIRGSQHTLTVGDRLPLDLRAVI